MDDSIYISIMVTVAVLMGCLIICIKSNCQIVNYGRDRLVDDAYVSYNTDDIVGTNDIV